MRSDLRKLLLASHLVASLGWLGALAVFFAHAAASVASADGEIVRAASIAMGITAWFVILPLSLAAVATGVVQALASAWGVLRHYWIVFKLLLTAVATIVLLLKLAPISHLAANAASASPDLAALRISLLAHAAGGLVVLLVVTVLAVYKPAGLIKGPMPGWAKHSAVGAGLLVLFAIAMLLAGGHGPRAHGPAPDGKPVSHRADTMRIP